MNTKQNSDKPCLKSPPPETPLIGDPDVFRRNLLRWFKKTQRDLPWRCTSDPYAIWVSEVMLQQTQVNTVLSYYRTFMKRFPTVHQLARAKEEAVLKTWEGLGYYARARNLHQAAAMVVDKHSGCVPDEWTELRRLPGIGDYIAAAVLSIAFQQPLAVLDGNVKRVLSRLGCIAIPVNRSTGGGVYQDLAQSLLNHNHPGLHNQAMMELGALVCSPRNPQCKPCPVASACCARHKGAVSQYPVRAAKSRPPLHHVAVGVVLKNGHLLITRRASKGLLGGLWEFPGGRQMTGETAEQACIREIREETGIDIDVIRRMSLVKHAYTHFKIEMTVFLCSHTAGSVVLNGPVDFRWVKPGDLEKYPFPKANLKFMPLLKSLPELPSSQ